jgi:hypothetical protein
MHSPHTSTLATVLCVAAAFLLPPAAAAQEPATAGKQEKQVRIETHVACEEGQDCTKRSHKILVSPDGDVKVLGGDDGNLVWLGRPGELAREALAGLDWARGAFLGVQLTDLTPELRRHFGVPEDQGVLVASVVEDSAAARAGIQVGDILTGLDGEAIASAGELARAVRKREAGAAVEVELWRDGRVEALSATLDEPSQRPGFKGARVFVRCDGDECEKGEGGEHPSMFFFQGNDGDGPGSFDCGLDENGNAVDCAIEVRCEDDACTCTVNGEAKLCDELDGVKTIRLRKKQGQQQ